MPRGNDLDTLRKSLPDDWKDIPILSYSQLMTADRCSFLWYVKYHLKLKSNKRSEKLDIGTFGHQFLHDLYSSIMDGMSQKEWVEVRLNPMVMDIVDSLNFEDQIVAASKAMQLVERYCRSDVLSGHTPVGSEQHFFVLVETRSGRRFILQGYIDLLTIDPKERVYIWDHKFTTPLWSRIRIKSVIQLPIYEILLQADGIPVYGVCVNLINSYPYKDLHAQPDDKLFYRDLNYWTPGQLSNIWNEFVTEAEDVLDLIEGKRPARRSLRDDGCYSCDMRHPCFAHLSGIPLDDAVRDFNEQQTVFRSMPAGTSVTLDLS